jgi:hypothetical protein
VTAETGPRHESKDTPHQRPPDPQEEADRPLEPKDKPRVIDPDRDPHAALNNPVGEPDPTSDTDPYQEASDDEQD